ncbi:DUF502 domain-containing protein [bacterium]|nr:DUF502 domain-containing protein [bacterium]MBU4561642.1 DUF502 domain-containing protein [bacterium]MCG2676760.1 DUF502 domain-containing protein [bacterium]MCG2677033.1 DUF502 domain-containing protein [bacterium]
MWVKIKRYFLTGLVAILPLMVTIWVLYQFFLFIDSSLTVIIRPLIEPLNLPLSWLWMGKGLTLLAILVLILLVGLFVRNVIGRRLLAWGEALFYRVPIVRRIYPFIRQVSNVLLGQKKRFFQRVVLVEYPRKGVYSLGFVTKEAASEIEKKAKKRLLTVFIPTTPNPTSGVIMLFPKKDTIPLEMSVEEGMKLIISGGTVIPQTPKR